ncbi:MAG TPA: CsbD family protein [Mycobacterium sp.]|nr:CsbD family protein [Mycobacterium sp.]
MVVVVLGGARVCSHVSTSGRGRDDLSREGQARQDKADAQRDAGKKGAEAESGRAGADAAEERQKKNQ